MTKKQHEIMSLSMEPEMVALLNTAAKKMGWSRSELIRKLVCKHLDLVVNEEDTIPVIIRIPRDLKDNEAELKQWLGIKAEGITKALCKK